MDAFHRIFRPGVLPARWSVPDGRMWKGPGLLAVAGWIGLALASGGEICADLIRLKSGGEVRGTIVSADSNTTSRSQTISVKTVTGALVDVPRDEIDFITRRSLVYEEYDLRTRLAQATVAAQWELAEWCREQRLDRQRDIHLREVVTLDPDNVAARRALGHEKRDGTWMTHAEYMESQGYVRFRGRYITPEELQLEESSLEQRQQQQAWFGKIRIWANWLSGRYEKQRQQAVQEFRAVNDPAAIPALQNFLGGHEVADVRQIYVDTLSQIRAPAALRELIRVAVLDEHAFLRSQATQKIPREQAAFAVEELVGYLRHEQNTAVRRAGLVLEELGDKHAVPHLIEALNTTHKYRVAVEEPAVGVSIGPGGAVLPGAAPLLPPGLQAAVLAGQIPPENIIGPRNPAPVQRLVTVRVEQQNPEVLAALQAITGADFGYDERTWRLWWLSQQS